MNTLVNNENNAVQNSGQVAQQMQARQCAQAGNQSMQAYGQGVQSNIQDAQAGSQDALQAQTQQDAQASPAPQTHHAHANFKRKEKKYVLEAGDYLALMALIGDKLEEDEYPYSHIESLYYDTPDWRMINKSMEKPLYKEKLRVRVYGDATESHVAFAELKKKFKGIVYKRRVAMSPQGAIAFMNGMDFDEAMRLYPPTSNDLSLEPTWRDRQIAAEIRACIDRWQPLQPSMIISVDRTSLRTNDGSDVRMTFDFDSRWRTAPLGFGEAKGEPLMEEGQVIMEIKAQKAYPLWLVHALDQAKIYPVSNTKYGRAYRAAFPAQPAGSHAYLHMLPTSMPAMCTPNDTAQLAAAAPAGMLPSAPTHSPTKRLPKQARRQRRFPC